MNNSNNNNNQVAKYHHIAQRVIKEAQNALQDLELNLPTDFDKVIDYILSLKGHVIFSGIGKSGYIARKISSSFSSMGIAGFFLHPAEASHGDLGMLRDGDLLIILSNSGSTKEIFNLVHFAKKNNIKIAIITMNISSALAKESDFVLTIPKRKEASSIGAPTTSTIMMLALGDALTIALQEIKQVTDDHFYLYHPGGAIGTMKAILSDIMRKNEQIPIVKAEDSFSEAILMMNSKMLGCTLVVEDNNQLIGIITDGDLRRHIKDKIDDKKVKDIMQKNPKYIFENQKIYNAIDIMQLNEITVLPVLQKDSKIVNGIIHIHDILKLN